MSKGDFDLYQGQDKGSGCIEDIAQVGELFVSRTNTVNLGFDLYRRQDKVHGCIEDNTW